MKFEITVMYRDYRYAYPERYIKEFDTEKEANQYCKEESWAGYSYFATKVTYETRDPALNLIGERL